MTCREDSSSVLAPMTKPAWRYDRGGITNRRKYTPQAMRCPVCQALVAIGPSFQDHVFWCRRENHDE